MTRLAKLHKNKKHEQAENTDFILRLRSKKDEDLPQKTDCINLFMQYVPLYVAMEKRLKELSNQNVPYLGIFNQKPWMDRSVALKNDIDQMTLFVASKDKQYLLKNHNVFPALEKMIAKIEKADGITLFACLAVRCLGDAFGGQFLNEYNQKIFDKKLTGAFYHGASKQSLTLGKFVNKAVLTETEEQQFFESVDDFFQLHIDLFGEMESDRELLVDMMPEIKEVKSRYSTCRYVLFGLVATVGVVTALGVAYNSLTLDPK